MNLLDNITDIPILIVLGIFLISILYCISKYIITHRNLLIILNFLSKFKGSELNFRFKELDNWMKENSYVSSAWAEFKNTLIFSESVAIKDGQNYQYKDISSTVKNIQTTVDPVYFFNEDSLVTSKFNYKFIQTIPSILTGCGPLFTFLKIAIAFGIIDFTSQEKTLESVSGFMTNMQTAALVSVIAVGSALIFLLLERLSYNKMCKDPVGKIQFVLSELFVSINSEKFLYELLRESKLSNSTSANLISNIPVQFKSAFGESVTTNLVPYLENVIFGLNQLNKQLKEFVKASDTNDIDNIF